MPVFSLPSVGRAQNCFKSQAAAIETPSVMVVLHLARLFCSTGASSALYPDHECQDTVSKSDSVFVAGKRRSTVTSSDYRCSFLRLVGYKLHTWDFILHLKLNPLVVSKVDFLQWCFMGVPSSSNILAIPGY